VILKDGDVQSCMLQAEDFGLEPVPIESLCVPADTRKIDYSMSILDGSVQGPALDLVCANAALLFHLADPSRDLRACTQHALYQFTSGNVRLFQQDLWKFFSTGSGDTSPLL